MIIFGYIFVKKNYLFIMLQQKNFHDFIYSMTLKYVTVPHSKQYIMYGYHHTYTLFDNYDK